jgi:tetratricopeptide (TPR) repeat protein
VGELAATLVKLNLKDEAASAYRRQAELFLEQELYSQALSACNEILILFPEDLETLQQMVGIYVLRGDIRGALTQCREFWIIIWRATTKAPRKPSCSG